MLLLMKKYNKNYNRTLHFNIEYILIILNK